MAAPKITCYVDIVSPFTYIAYYVLKNSPVFAKCNLTYIPVFLGGIMKETGNTPPPRVKNKFEWVNVDRLRWARYLNVPITPGMPDRFPVNTLPVQRTLSAISSSHPAKLSACIDVLFHALWAEGKAAQIEKPEFFSPILDGVLGADVTREVLAQAESAEAKALLLKNTGGAIDAGAFGLPWLVATNEKGETEGFFGVDHLAQLALFLGLDREVDRGFKALM